MACHICAETGERTCNPVEAEIKCLVCNLCATKKLLEEETRDE